MIHVSECLCTTATDVVIFESFSSHTSSVTGVGHLQITVYSVQCFVALLQCGEIR